MGVYVTANRLGILVIPCAPNFLLHMLFSNRDTFIYAASVESRAVDSAIKILGDVILRPKLNVDEVIFPVKKKTYLVSCLILF